MQKLLKNLLAAHCGAGNPTSKISLFAENRIIFRNAPAQPSETPRKPEMAEISRTQSFRERLNKQKEEKIETNYHSSPETTAENLASGTKPQITKDEILLRLQEGYDNHKSRNGNLSDMDFQTFWNALSGQTNTSPQRGPCTRVSLEKDNDEWKFIFRDNKGELVQFGAGAGVAIDAAPPATAKRQTAAQRQAIKARETRTSIRETRNQQECINGIKTAQSNTNFEIRRSILPLIDNERLWMDAWQNPQTVNGMRELKNAITEGFPHLNSNPDLVRKTLREAIAIGRDRYIDFGDLIEKLGENEQNPLRLPSPALRIDQLSPRQHENLSKHPSFLKHQENIEVFYNKERENQKDFQKTLLLARGFAEAIGSIPGADCQLVSATADKVTTVITVNQHIYYAVIDSGAKIYLWNYPSKRPYKNNEGYDQSENFKTSTLFKALDGRTSFTGQPPTNNNDTSKNIAEGRDSIKTWLINAVQPKATRGRILATYKDFIYEDGTPRPEMAARPDIVQWYQDVFSGSQRVLSALQYLHYDENKARDVEFERGLRELDIESERRTRNATPLGRFTNGITNPEATEMESGHDFWTLREGLSQLGNGRYEKVTRMTAGLLQTLPPGTRAIVIKPFPNHQVERTRPTITIKIKTPGYRAVTANVIHNTVGGPNFVEYINDNNQKKSKRYNESTLVENDPKVQKEFFDTITELGMRETTWHDVMEGSSFIPPESKLHTVMSAEFADTALRETLIERGAIDANGQYNEQKALEAFAALATKGLRDLISMAQTETHDNVAQAQIKANAENKIKEMEAALGGSLKVIHRESGTQAIQDLTIQDLQDPKKGPLLQELIQRGLIHELQEKENMKQNDIVERLSKLADDFHNDPRGRAAALKAIRDEYEKAKIKPPENLEQHFDQKVFPLMFALGLDISSGTLGLGVGTGIDIPLPGDTGTIHIGGGAGLGLGLWGENAGTVPGGGPAVGLAYSTPKWGRFSLTLGAGGGVNVLNGGLFGALGGTVNTDWGGDRFNHDTRGGVAVATIGGVPTVIPTALFSFKPDHEYRQNSMLEDALVVFGLEKDNPSLEEIAANSHITRMIILRNTEKLNNLPSTATTMDVLNAIGTAKVQADYKAIKEDLRLTVLQNYDPSQANSGHTFGLGYDTKNNKFIFLWVPNFVDYSSKEVTLRSSKNYESMKDEISLEQSFEILDQLRAEERIPESRIEELMEVGAIMRTGDGKLVVRVPNAAPLAPAETTETAEISDIESLESSLNRIYAPLGLGVRFDQQRSQFELIIKNRDSNTNYELAHSDALLGEGVQLVNGKIYINSAFAQNNTFTIRRSDFRYPFPYEGANTHSIITFSSDPTESPNEIYRHARTVIKGRSTRSGMQWNPAAGPDRFGVDIMAHGSAPRKSIDNSQFARVPRWDSFRNETLETQHFGASETGSTWDRLTSEARERQSVSAEQEAKLLSFAEKIMGKDGTSGRFARRYRQLSTNRMMLHDENPRLIEAVQQEWQKENPNNQLNDVEIQKVLNHLTHLSFSPLKGDTPEARNKEFERRLNYIKPRLERQFTRQIADNHKRHPRQDDPMRIKSNAKTLTNFAVERAKSINLETAQKTNISQVDRYMSLAATMGIDGMRGAGFTGDNAELYNLIKMPEGAELKLPLPDDAPQELKDLLKLAIDGLSPLPDIFRPLDTSKLNEFKKSPLTMQVFALMQDPKSALMFGSHPQYRYKIAEIMREDDLLRGELALGLPEAEEKLNALKAFNEILQTIREAQLNGHRQVASPFNDKFKFNIGFEAKDGLYERCTNYTMWISETLSAEVEIPTVAQKNYAGYAAYGRSTASATVSGITQPSTLFRLAAAVAVAVPKEPPPPPPPGGAEPNAPEAGPGSKVEQEGGNKIDLTKVREIRGSLSKIGGGPNSTANPDDAP